MSARVRHAHSPGEPRRTWPVLVLDDEPSDTTPVPDAPPSPLGFGAAMALRGQRARDQWETIRDEYGVIAAYEATTPRYGRRRVRRLLRQLRSAYTVLLNTALAVVIAVYSAAIVAPVLHGLGW